MLVLQEVLEQIREKDQEAMQKVREILKKKMKPEGSLGVLEHLVEKLAGIYSYPIPDLARKCHVVAAADNGVIVEQISSCPLDYTRLVTEAMLYGTATIAIFAKQLGVDLYVVDIGMKEDIPRDYPNLLRKKIRPSTRNLKEEKAMTEEECLQALEEGISFIREKSKDYDIFSNGEMGIGNTTTSSALLYALTEESLEDIVGYGGGLSEEGLARKKRVIEEAYHKHSLKGKSAFTILQTVGGYDIAFLVGTYIGAALCRKAIIVDGFISSVAAYIACQMEPKIQDYCIFSHKSEEPGVRIIQERLGEYSFLDMKMRLGEGTGGILVYPMLDCALAMLKELKTPEEVYTLFW